MRVGEREDPALVLLVLLEQRGGGDVEDAHDAVVEAAKRAKAAGSTRFCMGTAWREMGQKKGAFRKILSMVEEVNGVGLEVCCTLGMVNEEQAKQPKAAGLTA